MKRLVAIAALLGALVALVARPADAASGDALVPQACDANYWPCIPPPPPDLDCGDIRQRVWVIGPSDPHGFDGNKDGVGCEAYPVGPAGPPNGSPTTTTPPVPFVPPTTARPSCTNAGTNAPAAPSVAPPGLFTSISPTRVADTRATGALAAGESRTFTVTGGAIPTDAAMVAMNVTAVDPTATGYLTVYPGGANVPYASNLNFVAGTTIANFAMARVSQGRVTVYNAAGCTHVLLDVVGYTTASTGNGFTPITPARVKDTRTGLGGTGGRIGAGVTQTLSLAGIGGVPLAADAAVLNVTVVDPTATGYVTVSPAGEQRPDASTINYTAGTTIANLVVAKLGTSGGIDVFNAAGDAHVLVDVFGYYTSSGDTYIPVSPVRLYDVRDTFAFAADERRDVPLTGQAVPANATAVAINVTAVDPSAAGYLTVFPAGENRPGSSNINYTPGRTIAGLVIVKLGAGGRIGVYNSAGRTGVIVDVAGYFSPTTSGALPPLTVSAGGAPSAYVRAAFGDEWLDVDGDCHNTRAEVLMSETAAPVTFNPNGCTVNTGRWTDPWGGFTSTLASDFQIDHHVPLANAWRSGAWAWSDAQRLSFAQNLADPDALNATYGPLNTAKSDYAPDVWKPPLTASWCRYATAWARIKHDWNLTVTSTELAALQQMVASC